MCNVDVPDTDNWLRVPYLTSVHANRVYVQLRFSVRQCANFPRPATLQQCKVICQGNLQIMETKHWQSYLPVLLLVLSLQFQFQNKMWEINIMVAHVRVGGRGFHCTKCAVQCTAWEDGEKGNGPPMKFLQPSAPPKKNTLLLQYV